MRELWSHLNTPLAKGRKWSLPVQRLWSLLQNEWPKQATNQTKEEIGKNDFKLFARVKVLNMEMFSEHISTRGNDMRQLQNRTDNSVEKKSQW